MSGPGLQRVTALPGITCLIGHLTDGRLAPGPSAHSVSGTNREISPALRTG